MKPAISGLYGITPDTEDTRALLDKVGAALAGGMRWVQYRNKGSDAELRQCQALALRQLCTEHGARLIVNDDVWLALEIGADGVHLGRDDIPLADARARWGSRPMVGVSCYNRLDLALSAAAAGADYVAFGSFFASQVKPRAVPAEPSLLTTARERLDLPVVAIGGITLENAPVLIEAGASAIAVVTALFGAADIRAAARTFNQLFQVSRTRHEGHHDLPQ